MLLVIRRLIKLQNKKMEIIKKISHDKKRNINKQKHNLEYDFLDIQLNMIETDYKKKSLYIEVNNEYFSKYKLTHTEVIKKRYNDDKELLNFYNQYFNELEKMEKIGMCIWKLFGELWNDEKQSLILQILSLTLLIEKQSLIVKKQILNINKKKSKSKKPEDIRFKKDKLYLLKLLSINKNYYIKNLDFINIKSSFDDLEKIQLKKREESKCELYKEYERIYCDTVRNS